MDDLVRDVKSFFTTISSGGGSRAPPRTAAETKKRRPPPPAAAAAAEAEVEDEVHHPPPPTPERRSSFDKRSDIFDDAMSARTINIKRVGAFVFQYGVPDTSKMRPVVWKLLLNYLPVDRIKWHSELQTRRDEYYRFVEDLTANPYKELFRDDEEEEEAKHDEATSSAPAAVSALDDPLGATQGNEWAEYFKDKEVREEILKDIKRTYASFHFFNQKVNLDPDQDTGVRRKKPLKKPDPGLFGDNGGDVLQPPKKHQEEEEDDEKEREAKKGQRQSMLQLKPHTKADDIHHDMLLRILFIFAKLNPGIKYVQGMNELLAPIYYVFATDANANNAAYAEPDAFYCFSNLMAEVRDRFLRSMDSASSGAIGQVKEMTSLLQRVDPPVYERLASQEIDPRFYAFRWISLMLSQEFELPDVLRLWDSLFADPERFSFLVHCCCAMLVVLRDRLLAGDFSDNVKALQNFSENNMDIHIVLDKAMHIRRMASSASSAASNNKGLANVVTQVKI